MKKESMPLMSTEHLIKEIDRKQIDDTIRWMVANTPYRIAGSDDEKRAAEYITERMKGYGLETKLLEFNAYNSFPEYSKVEVIAPVPMQIDSLPCGHIRSTSKEGEEFELVYVGSGAMEDYEGLDVTGKAVLVEVSYSPATPEKARIAYAKGAKALVAMNWGSGQSVICHRALKSVWGNPTEETIGNIPHLVGVGVTQKDGWMLRDWCKEGKKVVLKIASIAPEKWSTVHQPFGILHGNGKSKQFMIVGSHVDAWSPGVTCNATGNATTLEIIRVLAKHREELDRDVWFVFWNGHEIAEAAGSTWMVDNYWDELNKHCVGYYNIDSTGMGEATLYEIKCGREYMDFCTENAKSIIDDELRVATIGKLGDQSFFGIGVPSSAQRCSYTKEYMAFNHGATLGWWNHTCEDGYDKYSPENIYKDNMVLTSLIYRVANCKVLPYDYTEKLEDLQQRIDWYIENYGSYIDMQDLSENMKAVRTVVEKLQNARDDVDGNKADLLNDFFMQIGRQTTNIFQTAVNKYQQDSYGHYFLSKKIPLFADFERLVKLDKDTIEYGMIETQLVKNKNRINDGLNNLLVLGKACCMAILGE